MTGKIFIIIGISLILIGAVLFVVTMSANNWDFKKIITSKIETNECVVEEDFNSIFINSDTTDIVIVPAIEECLKIVIREEENIKHSINVENGTLYIDRKDNRKWYEHIGIGFEETFMTLYMPLKEYKTLSIDSHTSDVSISKGFIFENIDIKLSTGDVECKASSLNEFKIKTSTGDIDIEDVSAKEMSLVASTGDIEADNVKCEGDFYLKVTTGRSELSTVSCNNFTTVGDTGDIILENFITHGLLDIKRSTGDVRFSSSDASEIKIETDTGDIGGSLLSEKVFLVTSDSGDVEHPKTASGGICEIITSTGDVDITLR